MVSTTHDNDAGLVSGALTTAMNLVALVVISLASTIFRFQLSSHFAYATKAHASLLSADKWQQIHAVLSQPDKVQHLLSGNDKLIAIYHSSFLSAFHAVYLSVLVLVLLAWLSSYFLMRKL